jgi:hypothetical protein
MCFSFEVSLGSFIFSWGTALYFLTKKLSTEQYHSILFLLIFSTVQLADALLWWDNMQRNDLNYYVTSFLIPTLLTAQVMFLPVVVFKNKYPLYTLLAAALSSLLYIRLNGYSRPIKHSYLSSPEWASPGLRVSEALIFAVAIFWTNISNFIYAVVIILTAKYLVGGAIGSLWCAVSTLASLYYWMYY